MKYIGTIKLTTTNDNDNLLLKVREKEHEIRPDFRLDDLGTSFIIRELEIKANIECDIIIDENRVILEAGEAISFKQPIRKLRCLKSGVDLIVNYAYGDLSSFDDDDCSHTCEPGAGGEGADLTDYYKKTETYNRVEVDTKIANVAGGGSVDLGNYYTKAEVDSKDNLKVDKVGGKSLVSDTEITRLATLKNYTHPDNSSTRHVTDTEKAAWNAKSNFDGNYNSLTNKPVVDVTKSYVDAELAKKANTTHSHSDLYYNKTEVDNKIANAGSGGTVDLSSYQTKSDNTLTTTAKTVVGAINENKSSLETIKTQMESELMELSTYGKTVISEAITNKGVNTSNTDTFQTMADNIGLIEGGGISDAPIYKTINGKLYREVVNEDFNDEKLNRNIFVDRYLTTCSETPYLTNANYDIADSILTLKIEKNMSYWNTWDTGTVISGVMTGERTALHHSAHTFRSIDDFFGLIAKYGYFELRAKMFKGSGTHCAWWMVGIQDEDYQRYEVDIFENLGRSPSQIQSVGHQNGDTTSASVPTKVYDTGVDLSSDFNVYGFEWTENEVIFYFNDVEYYRANTSITYPLVTLLSAYEKRLGGWTGAFDDTIPYPKEFKIDYLKMYKRADRELNNISITSIEQIDISETKTLDPNTGILTELPSYCTVNWSDGTTTEHWVKWCGKLAEYETYLGNNTNFQWKGTIVGLGKTIFANILYENIVLEGVSLQETLLLNKNDQYTLIPTFTPTNATNKNVTWSSSNTSVATVNNGVVTGISNGTTVITVESVENTSLKDTCNVTVQTVNISVSSVALNKTTTTIGTGKTEQLTATISPTNATNKNVTWSSSNTGVATVSASGLVTGVSVGSATITVTTADGNKTAICNVSVVYVDPTIIYELPNATTFTGSTFVETNVKLFDTDKDFSLVYDYTPSATNTTGNCLVHCMKEVYPYKGITMSWSNWNSDAAQITYMDINFPNLDTLTSTTRRKIVFVKSGTTIKVYNNNSTAITKASSTTFEALTETLVIGAKKGTDGSKTNHWLGTVHSFKVYNKALTQSDVDSLFN